MAKLWEDIKFGIGLGIGLLLAYAVIRLIIWFLSQATAGRIGAFP